MTPMPPNQTRKKYTFRGKTFECDPKTIAQMNYALALNRSQERYEEVQAKPKRTI